MLTLEIERLACAMVNNLGLLDAYAFLKRRRIGSQVAIILYHRVSTVKDDWSLETLSPQSFERQIKYFRENYEMLSLEELAPYVHERKSLPKKAVVITFDDGYRDNYLYAFPILRKYRAPATIFLATGHIGTAKLFWWDKVRYAVQHTTPERLELGKFGSYSLESALDRRHAGFAITEKLMNLPDERKNSLIEKLINVAGVDIPDRLGRELILSWNEVVQMSRDGIDLGAHSVTHPILTNIPLERARWEIVQSKNDIETRLGKPVSFFSYPNSIFNPEIVKLVEQSGFAGGITDNPVWITHRDNPYKLGRIGAAEDFNIFKVMFCGFWGDLQSILGRAEDNWKQSTA